MSILNLILKSGHINIALLHDKISNKCHNIPSIGTLACFIGTFSLINTNRHLFEILSCNRAIFTRPDFNTMRFNIDSKVILKKWLVQLMCMVQFLCRLLDISYEIVDFHG